MKRSPAEKAPARKATKTTKPSPAKSRQSKPKATKSAATARKKPVAASSKTAKGKASPPPPARKAAPVRPQKKSAQPASKSKAAPSKSAKPVNARRTTPAAPAQPPPRQPTRDEAAALRAFERAHREFVRGRFADARALFRTLVEKHAGVSEVTARARTYLAIADARLRTESTLPRDADSLYDRGVIELNRGEYVAAQEMFERALKREPEAAHIHYGLAATRARLGAIDSALESLQRALDLQPNLRVRAQHDQDLTVLRNDPDFERLVFAPRF
ncbi:MAG TPA: tetratricopeptide repeat protein [Pyrinomonadaceae bacterium]|nr:tetratricopeptide repeat protein [Pyrinomonadaceae bacterium]